jgi:hypothetical protein
LLKLKPTKYGFDPKVFGVKMVFKKYFPFGGKIFLFGSIELKSANKTPPKNISKTLIHENFLAKLKNYPH